MNIAPVLVAFSITNSLEPISCTELLEHLSGMYPQKMPKWNYIYPIFTCQGRAFWVRCQALSATLFRAPAATLVPILLACFAIARSYFLFLIPQDEYIHNHDGVSYPLRLIEFRELLFCGYLSPQWAPDFRGGLGSPYFGYYQPGFFYAASLLPASIPLVHRLGWTVAAFGGVGAFGIFRSVARISGPLWGTAASFGFLFFPYISTQLVQRGDLSEFAATMLASLFVSLVIDAAERPSRAHIAVAGFIGGCMVCTHPCVSLPVFMFLSIGGFVSLLWSRSFALVALFITTIAAGISALYWCPLFLEWNFVEADLAFGSEFRYSLHFIELHELLGGSSRYTLIDVRQGSYIFLAVFYVGVVAFRAGHSSPRRRAIVVAGLCVITACVFLMSCVSETIWSVCPLLYRLQFPWRLLCIIAIAASVMIPVGLSCLSRPQAAALAFSCGIAAAVFNFGCGLKYEGHLVNAGTVPLSWSQSGRDIAGKYFAPDVAGEWVPRGAAICSRLIPTELDADAVTDDGTAGYGFRASRARVWGPGDVAFRQRGHIFFEYDCDFRGECIVELPHLFFPVGCHAELAGVPIAIGQGELGLIRFHVREPRQGKLRLQFDMTPARRVGIGISLTAMAICAGLCWPTGRREPQAETSRGWLR